MRPDDGASSPAIVLSSVDFPAPLPPINVTISPWATSSDTERSASTAPYRVTSSRTSSMGVDVLAQIDLEHGGIGLDFRRRALGDLLAVVENDDPVGHAHDEAHVVLDDEDRDPE